MPEHPTPTQKKIQETGFHEPYARFSGLLRAWLVAYGIGAPALFLTQESVANALRASGQTGWIAGLFLFGVAAQIVAALLYKSSMWYLYAGELKESFKSKFRFRAADFVSEAFWLELSFDIISIVAFAWGTFDAWLILAA